MEAREIVVRAGRLVRVAVRWELAIYRDTVRWIGRRYDVPAGGTAFPYVGAVSVLLWAFIIGSAVELVALHVVLPWEHVRLVADILGIWGLLWMVGLSGGYHVYPHVLTDEGLRIRNGHSVDIFVPLSAIGTVVRKERSLQKNRSLQVEGEVLSVVLVSRTELDLRLVEPITVTVRGTEHVVTEIRMLADDSRALARALNDAVAASR